MTGLIPLPWEQSDSINIRDAYGNPVYIPTTTVFSLAFSLLSMIKAIVYFNIVRIHIGVSITLPRTAHSSNMVRNIMFKSWYVLILNYLCVLGLMMKHRTAISSHIYMYFI